jgi:DNA-directed RNA polymerase specialized sigma24 family protein
MSQATLAQFASVSPEALDDLTGAERKAYVACRINGVGGREQARFSGRSPGTVGNLLRRAEKKLEQRGGR